MWFFGSSKPYLLQAFSQTVVLLVVFIVVVWIWKGSFYSTDSLYHPLILLFNLSMFSQTSSIVQGHMPFPTCCYRDLRITSNWSFTAKTPITASWVTASASLSTTLSWLIIDHFKHCDSIWSFCLTQSKSFIKSHLGCTIFWNSIVLLLTDVLYWRQILFLAWWAPSLKSTAIFTTCFVCGLCCY